MKNKDLKKRIVEISYKNKVGHLGSNLTSVDIIEMIYEMKPKEEEFVLSNGHAGLALYVVLEKHGFGNAEAMFKKHGVHPNRDKKFGIDCSTGSLGQGLPIAVGMALADRDKNVYCLISDGECAEGSIWEALRIIKEQEVRNLLIMVNANGYSAYGEVDGKYLSWRLNSFVVNNIPQIAFIETNYDEYPFLDGLNAHYYIPTKEDYGGFRTTQSS